MNESLKQLRLERSREFNKLCDKLLAHEGRYPKPIIRILLDYKRKFIAATGDDELRELASNDLRRLTIIELYIEERNAGKA